LNATLGELCSPSVAFKEVCGGGFAAPHTPTEK